MRIPSGNVLKFYIWKFTGAFYFFFPLKAIYLFSKGITASELALYIGIQAILITAFEIPTGFIADKFSRKLSVSLGFLCTGLSYVALIFVSDFYSLIPVAILAALGRALNSGAEESLIYDDLKNKNEESTYLKLTSRGLVISTISGAIASFAGPIFYTFNHALPFIFSAIPCFILTFFVMTFKENKISHEVPKQLKILDGVKKVFHIKAILIIVLVDMLLTVFALTYYQILFFPKINDLGLDIKHLGTLDVITIGLLSLTWHFLTKLSFKKDYINVIIYSIAVALIFIVFSLVNNLAMALFFGILFDLVWSARLQILPAITNKYFESHNRALSLSSMSFITNLGSALLMPIAALLFNSSYLYGFIIFVFVVLLLFLFPKKNPA